MATKNKYVPRVNQIDAIYLNEDINRIIRQSLLENLQAISPALFVRIQPEIDLLIQIAVWLGSVRKQSSSFGQQLLALAYDSEQLTGIRSNLHFILTVLPKYIKAIDEKRLSGRSEWIHRTIKWVENIVLVLSVLNFFRFLKSGRRPTLIDYLLGLDYVSLRSNQRRDIGYKYITRELFWGGFMEILGLVLPIINFRKIQRILKSKFSYTSPGNNRNLHKTHETILVPKMSINTTCTYCGERPTLPHHLFCGHIYCYYCLSANVLTDADFACSACGTNVRKITNL